MNTLIKVLKVPPTRNNTEYHEETRGPWGYIAHLSNNSRSRDIVPYDPRKNKKKIL